MQEFITQHPALIMTVAVSLVVVICVAGCVIAYGLWRGMEVNLTKGGLSFSSKTPSAFMHNVGEHIDKIDRQAKHSLKNATLDLPIPGIEHSKNSEIVRLKMLLPLLFAVYENHHTRELAERNAPEYVATKVNQILRYVGSPAACSIQDAETLVYQWVKKVAITVVNTCKEKIQVYKSYMRGADQDTKDVLEYLVKKNEDYIIKAEELDTFSAVQTRVKGIKFMDSLKDHADSTHTN